MKQKKTITGQLAYLIDLFVGVVCSIGNVFASNRVEHISLDGARCHAVDSDPLVPAVDSLAQDMSAIT